MNSLACFYMDFTYTNQLDCFRKSCRKLYANSFPTHWTCMRTHVKNTADSLSQKFLYRARNAVENTWHLESKRNHFELKRKAWERSQLRWTTANSYDFKYFSHWHLCFYGKVIITYFSDQQKLFLRSICLIFSHNRDFNVILSQTKSKIVCPARYVKIEISTFLTVTQANLKKRKKIFWFVTSQKVSVNFFCVLH